MPLLTPLFGEQTARFASTLVLGVLAICVHAVGDDPPAVDRYGDPLAAGALVQLGPARLRNHGGVASVAFSPDGRVLASCGPPAFAEAPSYRSVKANDLDCRRGRTG